MARTLLSSGSSFETDIGYSRAVIDGDWIFVSGTTGFDYATMTIPDDVVAQCKQSMRNIASVLSQAGEAYQVEMASGKRDDKAGKHRKRRAIFAHRFPERRVFENR